MSTFPAFAGVIIKTMRSAPTRIIRKWPRMCEKSEGCYDSFFESAGGSDGCQALWKELTGAKAHFFLPRLTTTWLRTIWFVRLTLSLKALILASLALVVLRRWKKGGPPIIRRCCSRYTFTAISIAFRRAAAWSGNQRNIELVWLTGHLAPDFKTIADFRKDNGEAVREVCRTFVALCRELDLLSVASVAIDGSKFQGCDAMLKVKVISALLVAPDFSACSNVRFSNSLSSAAVRAPRPRVLAPPRAALFLNVIL